MNILTDVFQKFTIKNQDVEGLLSLYEASYLGTNDDDILSWAMTFAENELRKSIVGGMSPENIVSRALELPRHLRMERLESRLYIDEYSKQNNHNALLLQLAKHDFNQVQSLYQMELAEVSRYTSSFFF